MEIFKSLRYVNVVISNFDVGFIEVSNVGYKNESENIIFIV